MVPVQPALEGFFLGGGLIVAIGAQNAFILRQGLLQQHVFILCLVASISDAALIAIGVAGFGTFVSTQPELLLATTLVGGCFLTCYALIALRRVANPSALTPLETAAPPLSRALAILLTFTFLNPHVYLDTVLLVGGVSALHEGVNRLAFGAGAMSASFCWFFALGYGAALLRPWFARPAAWRVLDALIAFIMASIAASLFGAAWNQWQQIASS